MIPEELSGLRAGMSEPWKPRQEGPGRRYLVIPPELGDGEHYGIISPENLDPEVLKDWLHDAVFGEEIVIRWCLMTDDEVAALPDM